MSKARAKPSQQPKDQEVAPSWAHKAQTVTVVVNKAKSRLKAMLASAEQAKDPRTSPTTQTKKKRKRGSKSKEKEEEPEKKRKTKDPLERQVGEIKHFQPPILAPEQGPEIRSSLRKLGYAAVRVFTDSEADELASLLWDKLENMCPLLERDDRVTWTKDKFIRTDHGVISSYGIGQNKANWKARCHPNVQATFRQVWSCNKETKEQRDRMPLMTSLDGVGVSLPPIHAKTSPNHWPHIDQHPMVHDWLAVQGAINLYDATDHTSGATLVWPETHKTNFAKLCPKQVEEAKGNFFQIPKGCIPSDATATALHVPKGVMVLWSSQLIHANIPASDPSANPRFVLYVCQVPTSVATRGMTAKQVDKLIEKRTEYVRTNRTCNHWPGINMRVNSDGADPRRGFGCTDPKPYTASLPAYEPTAEEMLLIRGVVAPRTPHVEGI